MHEYKNDFSVKQLIGHYIGVAHASLRRDFIATLKAQGISCTPEQFTILVRLDRSDGISQKELAEYAVRDNAGITRVLDILEKKQFIVRKRAENDRRTNLIYISEQGREILKTLFPLVKQRNEELLQGLSSGDIEEFVRLITTITAQCNKEAVHEEK